MSRKSNALFGGLTPPIQGNVIAAYPETLDSVKRLAQKLYDHRNKKGTNTLDAETKKEDRNKRTKASRDRQKSYTDKRRKPLEFQGGYCELLKATPWKGMVRYGKRRKLNQRYIGPFKILARIGKVAYNLQLPSEPSNILPVFHVSNWKKCLSGETLVVPRDEIEVNNNLLFVEEPVEIMDRELKHTKQSQIPIIKIRWSAKRRPKFTWERKDQMMQKYPHFFSSP
ncbi:hypothetical protein Lser_V15G19032 [Lactuca serriola]